MNINETNFHYYFDLLMIDFNHMISSESLCLAFLYTDISIRLQVLPSMRSDFFCFLLKTYPYYLFFIHVLDKKHIVFIFTLLFFQNLVLICFMFFIFLTCILHSISMLCRNILCFRVFYSIFYVLFFNFYNFVFLFSNLFLKFTFLNQLSLTFTSQSNPLSLRSIKIMPFFPALFITHKDNFLSKCQLV